MDRAVRDDPSDTIENPLPPLILVVDDDPMTCLLAEETLRQNGFRTYTANSCRSALEAASQLGPAAVLLDAGLSDGDGLKLCEQLRQGHNLPVVLTLDMRHGPISAERAYETGAADVMPKPLVWEVLGPRIRHLLATWSAVAEQQYLSQQQECLKQILNLPVAETSLESLLQRTLQLVLQLPWIGGESSGAIFLAEGGRLRLVARGNSPADTLMAESQFALQHCHCGEVLAGQGGHFVTLNHHGCQVTAPGVLERKYCHVPLDIGARMLGVMVLPCPERREWNRAQVQVLATLGKVIAGQIERKHADRKLTLTVNAFEDSLDAAMIVTKDMTIVEVNRKFTELTGLEADEVRQRPLQILKPVISERRMEQNGADSVQHFIDQWEGGRTWQGEVWLRHKSGKQFLCWMQVVRSAGGGHSYLFSFSDISERKREAEDIRRLAFYDQLTGLCNRSLLMDRLNLECRRSARNGTALAVLFFDLDRFKAVNDVLGHDQGDLLLKETARRIQGIVREQDTVARLGGDEFVVVLTGLDKEASVARRQAARVAEKIIETIRQPCQLTGQKVVTSASIGIAMGLRDEREPARLLKLADLAMYAAKREGRDCYRFYQPYMSQLQIKRLNLQERIRQALEREAFSVHFQPRLRIADRALVGAEALVRWRDGETNQWIPPQEFIPLAEETGLIDPLYEWIVEQVCRHQCRWDQAGLAKGLQHIAVNVGTRQFQQRNFAGRTLALMEKLNLQPCCRLELEITEAAIMRYPQESHHALSMLKEAGIRIAIDDFGTGYSNMLQLRRFPIDLLKIDRSFVSACPNDEDDAAIVRIIVSMARELQLKVVAEGVEAIEQLEFLRQLGCDFFQGYLCAPALTPDEFEAFLRNVS